MKRDTRCVSYRQCRRGLFACLAFFGLVSGASAEFTMNFQKMGGPVGGSVDGVFTCNHPIYGNTAGDCDTAAVSFVLGLDQSTPVVQEAVSYGGKEYWHQIVGTPSSGFAQEVYIEKGTTAVSYTACSSSMGDMGPAWCGGGTTGAATQPSGMSSGDWFGNGLSPLHPNDKYTGTASANPDKVVMRMILDDAKGGMSAEFLKANLLKKPKITQDVSTPEIKGNFVFDMSAIYNSERNIPGVMTNRFDLLSNDPGLPPESRHFDALRDGQHLDVTGGRYMYTAGAGILQSAGTYTYGDGRYGYDPSLEDYLSYRNIGENPGGMMCSYSSTDQLRDQTCNPTAAGPWDQPVFQ